MQIYPDHRQLLQISDHYHNEKYYNIISNGTNFLRPALKLVNTAALVLQPEAIDE